MKVANILIGLLSRSKLDERTGCMNWLGYCREGRATFFVKRHPHSVSRAVFSLAHPAMDISKAHICHHCDNPKCINPDHLYAGNAYTNRMDAVRRNRIGRKAPLGEAAHKHKLKNNEIPLIRNRIAQGDSCVKIALDYLVSHTVIYAIKHGKAWKHVP